MTNRLGGVKMIRRSTSEHFKPKVMGSASPAAIELDHRATFCQVTFDAVYIKSQRTLSHFTAEVVLVDEVIAVFC